MINQIYKLNMIPDKVPVMVRVSQYDQYSRTIIFDLYDGAIEYEIPNGSIISIRGTKPDKTGFEYPCTFAGNRVEFLLEPQVSVISGIVPAELRITSSNEIVGSCNFIFNVEETPLDKDTIISDTELPLIEEASQAAVIAQGAAARAEAEADRASQVLTSAVKSVNNKLPDEQGNVEMAIPDVSNKMNKVSSPTANDILLVDSLGQAIDSGKSMFDILKNVKVLGSSDNINDITENGFYYVDTGTVGISDAWVGSMLLVFGDDNKKIQYFFKPDGATDPDGVDVFTIMRSYQNNTWSAYRVPLFGNNVIKGAGLYSDLNLTNLSSNITYFGRTNTSTSNIPDSAGNAFVITAISNVNSYGRQLYISDQGIYTRILQSGSWETSWKRLDKEFDSVSITFNSTYINSTGYQRVVSNGELVVATLNFRLSASGPDQAEWGSGFPLPKRPLRIPFFMIFGSTPLRCYIDSDGILRADGAWAITGWGQGTVVYEAR